LLVFVVGDDGDGGGGVEYMIHMETSPRSLRAALAKGTVNHSRYKARQKRTCPFVQKQPNMTHSTARRRSQESKTMAGDLPPSSSVTFLMPLAAGG
jgi:hypothetical protein